MKALIFVPDLDSPGKKDMSQAFLPSARAFARANYIDIDDALRRFPANAPIDQRRAVCTLAMRASSSLDAVAFFCHGWKAGIQAGFMRQHNLLLARILGQVAKSPASVLLYACETGRDLDDETADDREPGPGGDGGFADGIRDACDALGRRVTVMGHTTAGHCAENPYARFFAPDAGGKGGAWYVEPQSPLWPLWVSALHDPKSTLRYRFWSMSPTQIAAELRNPPALPPLVA